MLQAGIVGLPNVGKSTLFNALTRSRKAEAANYPFCTIDPNVGAVEVPDERLAPLAKIAKTSVIIPAAMEFVDIAGLVAGREQGRGPRQQIPRPHPRGQRHRPRRPLFRRPGRRPHHGRRGPRARHRDHLHRAAALRPRKRAEPAQPRAHQGQGPRQGCRRADGVFRARRRPPRRGQAGQSDGIAHRREAA